MSDLLPARIVEADYTCPRHDETIHVRFRIRLTPERAALGETDAQLVAYYFSVVAAPCCSIAAQIDESWNSRANDSDSMAPE